MLSFEEMNQNKNPILNIFIIVDSPDEIKMATVEEIYA